MISRSASRLAVFAAAIIILVVTSRAARADGLAANWTLNDGGAAGNTIGAGTAIADSSGNGFNGAVVSNGDTLQSVPGVIGNGLYFSGDNSANYSYISVPATLAGSDNLGQTDILTISMWVNIPAGVVQRSNKAAVDLYTDRRRVLLRRDRVSAKSRRCRGLVYGFTAVRWSTTSLHRPSGNHGFWSRTDGTGWIREHVGADHCRVLRRERRYGDRVHAVLRQREIRRLRRVPGADAAERPETRSAGCGRSEPGDWLHERHHVQRKLHPDVVWRPERHRHLADQSHRRLFLRHADQQRSADTPPDLPRGTPAGGEVGRLTTRRCTTATPARFPSTASAPWTSCSRSTTRPARRPAGSPPPTARSAGSTSPAG